MELKPLVTVLAICLVASTLICNVQCANTLNLTTTGSCCDFDAIDCSATYTNWYWSLKTPPPPQIPPSIGYYIYTNIGGAQLTFPTSINVNSLTTIKFKYYISDPSVELMLWFFPTSSSPTQLTIIPYSSSSSWSQINYVCTTCCSGSTCNGQFSIQTVGPNGHYVAIDNVNIADSCADTYPCCDFEDNTLCQFNDDNIAGYTWKSSLTYTSYYVPYPGSSYVFFEVVGYSDDSYLNVRLSSTVITVSTVIYIEGHFYAYTANTASVNTLQIIFHNYDRSSTTILKEYINTDDWDTAIIPLDPSTVCGGSSSCSGELEITANVKPYGGTVAYAVDWIYNYNSC
ncbi:hypothetical protein CHUAL_008318 [Chamberlinius hualienensis]